MEISLNPFENLVAMMKRAHESKRESKINFEAHKSCNLLFVNANLLTFIVMLVFVRHKISSLQFNKTGNVQAHTNIWYAVSVYKQYAKQKKEKN